MAINFGTMQGEALPEQQQSSGQPDLGALAVQFLMQQQMAQQPKGKFEQVMSNLYQSPLGGHEVGGPLLAFIMGLTQQPLPDRDVRGTARSPMEQVLNAIKLAQETRTGVSRENLNVERKGVAQTEGKIKQQELEYSTLPQNVDPTLLYPGATAAETTALMKNKLLPTANAQIIAGQRNRALTQQARNISRLTTQGQKAELRARRAEDRLQKQLEFTQETTLAKEAAAEARFNADSMNKAEVEKRNALYKEAIATKDPSKFQAYIKERYPEVADVPTFVRRVIGWVFPSIAPTTPGVPVQAQGVGYPTARPVGRETPGPVLTPSPIIPPEDLQYWNYNRR